MAIVYLCLGSNKGDRVGYIQQATSLLAALKDTKIVRTSSLYETEPWLEKKINWFVNAVIEIKTALAPQELLAECLRIEKQLGRNREQEEKYGDRTIDIDILFYDKLVYEDEELIIPHVDLHNRYFVLKPMSEIAPNFRHPLLGQTINQLLISLDGCSQIGHKVR